MIVKGPQPSIRSLNQAQENHRKTMSQLASGKRINRAGDDAAGLGIAKKMDAREVSLSQAGRNLADAGSFAQVVEGGLSGAQSMVSRLRELAVQAGNGTLSSGQRQSLQTEAGHVQQELARLERTTEFNGSAVFEDGKSLEVQAGPDSGETVTLDPGGGFVAALGLDTLDLSTADGARGAIDALDAASESISSRQAAIGASSNRFQIAQSGIDSSRQAVVAARSRIEDADVAEATSRSVAERIRSQVAVGVHDHAQFSQSLLGSLVQSIG